MEWVKTEDFVRSLDDKQAYDVIEKFNGTRIFDLVCRVGEDKKLEFYRRGRTKPVPLSKISHITKVDMPKFEDKTISTLHSLICPVISLEDFDPFDKHFGLVWAYTLTMSHAAELYSYIREEIGGSYHSIIGSKEVICREIVRLEDD